MFSAPFLVTLLDRVKAVVRRVARPAVERARRGPAVEPGVSISPVLHGMAQDWMSAKLRALSALMRRVEMGEPLDIPVPAPRAARGGVAPGARDAVPPD